MGHSFHFSNLYVTERIELYIRDVEAEAEAGGASGGRKFLESLEAEASKMEARRRLRLRTFFESFIFFLKIFKISQF